MTIVIYPEARRKANRPTRGEIPRRDWCDVTRSFMQSKILRIAQATVEFYPSDKILPTEIARIGRGIQSQRTAGTDRIPKFPRLAGQQLLCVQRIHRKVPATKSL